MDAKLEISHERCRFLRKVVSAKRIAGIQEPRPQMKVLGFRHLAQLNTEALSQAEGLQPSLGNHVGQLALAPEMVLAAPLRKGCLPRGHRLRAA
jgi:hypothetical protein